MCKRCMEEFNEMVQLNHEVLQSVLKPSRYTGGRMECTGEGLG